VTDITTPENPVTDITTTEEKRPVVYIPPHLHPRDIMDVLRRLDIVIPDSLEAAAVDERPLYGAGHKFTEAEIDAALAKVDVVDQEPPPEHKDYAPPKLDITVGGPLRLKTALSDCSILEE
jgi:hypothetical protein